MKRTLKRSLAGALKIACPLLALITLTASLVGCGGGGGTITPPPPVVTLVSIAVAPASQSIAVNATQQFTATGTYSDASSRSLTAQVTWSSSATGVATVNSSGMATAVASGVTTITAALGSVSGSRSLTVSPILVSPPGPSVAVNTTTQFTASGTFSDGSAEDLTLQVVWASSATGVASVDNTGLADSLAAGTTAISATLGAISGSTTLTVTAPTLNSIVLTPDRTSVPLGISQPFVATGNFSDGSSQTLTSDCATGRYCRRRFLRL